MGKCIRSPTDGLLTTVTIVVPLSGTLHMAKTRVVSLPGGHGASVENGACNQPGKLLRNLGSISSQLAHVHQSEMAPLKFRALRGCGWASKAGHHLWRHNIISLCH